MPGIVVRISIDAVAVEKLLNQICICMKKPWQHLLTHTRSCCRKIAHRLRLIICLDLLFLLLLFTLTALYRLVTLLFLL